jgi:hypothetical protein
MKKSIQILAILFLVICDMNAQQEKGITGFKSWLNNWTEFKPNKAVYDDVTQILTGNISVNTKLLKKNVYLLQGNVYLTDNATLTIEPGTVIMGDFDSKASLVITKGATLVAEGLETDPIVFTSNRPVRKAGDWGGIIVLGDAPISKFGNLASVNFDTDLNLSFYGGNNPASNSGILKFVRIEYAGGKVKGKDNFNSLLLAGVGNKTKLENIMVSYSAGDSFEILGGEVNLTQIISFKSSSDDYKFNYGTQCNIENSLAIRSSFLNNTSGSRCFNVRSYDKKEEVDFTKKQTLVTARNVTLVNNSENVKAEIESGLIKEAVYVAENASIDFKKSVISGFNPAILLDKEIDINDQNLKKIKLEQMYFNLCKGNIFVEHNSNNEDLESWYGNAIFANVYSKAGNSETFIDFINDKRPDYRLRIGSITVSKD